MWVQIKAKKWIRFAETIPGLAINRPNTHSLIELVLRDLPCVGNVNFVSSECFERHHKDAKNFSRTISNSGAANVELLTMKYLQRKKRNDSPCTRWSFLSK